MEATAFLDLPGGRTLRGFGKFRTTNVVPEGATAFYRNDFGLGSAQPWLIPDHWEITERTTGISPSIPDCTWEAPDASAFAEVFHEISASIRAGVFEKTVPVVVERGQLASEPGDLLLTAAAAGASEPLLGYGFSDGHSGFAGASPERLFSLADGVVKTMALAGTARTEEGEVLAVDE